MIKSNYLSNYLLWGFISTGINLLIFKILISFNLNLFFILFLYYLTGTMIKFFGYKYFVFKRELFKYFIHQFIKYIIFVFSIMLLNYLFLKSASKFTNIEYFYLQIIWIGLSAPLSYVVSKSFIFK